MGKISFGTDGWRAVISDDFTFENVKIISQAIADYVKSEHKNLTNKKSELYGKKYAMAIGYDTRFLSEKYAELVACVLAANGIKVILSDSFTPTPAVSFYITRHNLLGGVMITASHNPAAYNGVKYKGYFGGSVGKEITGYMESRLHKTPVKFMPKDEGVKKGLIKYDNLVGLHLKYVKKFVNMKLLKKAGLRVLVDSMNGTGAKFIEGILEGTTNKVTTLNGTRDTYFGGRSPEPNDVHLKSTSLEVKKTKCDVCLCTDGDADRLGVILPDGEILTGHKVMTLLLVHLLKNRKLRGGIIQTICGTGLMNKIAEEYSLKTYETPVGFKYISDLFLNEDILIGGEETGGIAFKGWIPERDGIMSGLLILELMAAVKKPLKKIVDQINKEYGMFVYKRRDLKFPADKRKRLLDAVSKNPFKTVIGKKVVDVKTYDGFKFILEDGSWLMLRASGTEPKLRVYSEGMSDKEALEIVEFGRKYAMSV